MRSVATGDCARTISHVELLHSSATPRDSWRCRRGLSFEVEHHQSIARSSVVMMGVVVMPIAASVTVHWDGCTPLMAGLLLSCRPSWRWLLQLPCSSRSALSPPSARARLWSAASCLPSQLRSSSGGLNIGRPHHQQGVPSMWRCRRRSAVCWCRQPRPRSVVDLRAALATSEVHRPPILMGGDRQCDVGNVAGRATCVQLGPECA